MLTVRFSDSGVCPTPSLDAGPPPLGRPPGADAHVGGHQTSFAVINLSRKIHFASQIASVVLCRGG